MKELEYITGKVQLHHQKAVECWGRTLFHAWWCGKYLWKIKKRVGHGNFGPWLKANFKGSERTARYYMRLAKGYKEPPQDAKFTIRDALNALGTRSANTKRFNRDDIYHAQAFRAFLKAAWKDWEPEEIEYLKSSLGVPCELEELVVRAMQKVRAKIQEELQQTRSKQREIEHN